MPTSATAIKRTEPPASTCTYCATRSISSNVFFGFRPDRFEKGLFFRRFIVLIPLTGYWPPAPEAWQPRAFAWRTPQQTHGAGLCGGQNPNLRTGVIHGGRSIRPTLPPVGAGFGKVPEVVDHAGTDKGAAFAVKCNAPWITRALAKDLKLTSLCMNTKHRTCKIKAFLLLLNCAGIKIAVESIQPTVWPPCQ